MSFRKKSFAEIRDAVLDDITSRGRITDRNVGSVSRTLVEGYAREMATFYEALQNVYDSAFVDTATGKSLEFVVSLLGIDRIRAGRAEGTATFSRKTPAEGEITIPKGTIITRPRGNAEEQVSLFETTETRTLSQGETRVDVAIQAQEPGEPGRVEPRELTVLPRPIVGIEAVTNEEGTTLRVREETDEEIRERAKNALRNTGKATGDAIEFALRRLGVESVEIVDRPRGLAGEIDVIADGVDLNDLALKAEINKTIHDTKAAGIAYNLNFTKRVNIYLKLRVNLREAILVQEELTQLLDDVAKRVEDYVSSLRMGDLVRKNGIITAALGNKQVLELEFLPFDDTQPPLFFKTGETVNGRRDFESIEEIRERAMDSGDIFMGKRERAVLHADTDLITDSDLFVKERKSTVFLALEDDSLLLSGDREATESQILEVIRTNVQIFLESLVVELENKQVDLILDFKQFRKLLQVEGYTVESSNLRVVLLHELDGLEVTLSVPGERDTIHVNEAVEIKNVKVQVNLDSS